MFQMALSQSSGLLDKFANHQCFLVWQIICFITYRLWLPLLRVRGRWTIINFLSFFQISVRPWYDLTTVLSTYYLKLWTYCLRSISQWCLTQRLAFNDLTPVRLVSHLLIQFDARWLNCGCPSPMSLRPPINLLCTCTNLEMTVYPYLARRFLHLVRGSKIILSSFLVHPFILVHITPLGPHPFTPDQSNEVDATSFLKTFNLISSGSVGILSSKIY